MAIGMIKDRGKKKIWMRFASMIISGAIRSPARLRMRTITRIPKVFEMILAKSRAFLSRNNVQLRHDVDPLYAGTAC